VEKRITAAIAICNQEIRRYSGNTEKIANIFYHNFLSRKLCWYFSYLTNLQIKIGKCHYSCPSNQKIAE